MASAATLLIASTRQMRPVEAYARPPAIVPVKKPSMIGASFVIRLRADA